MISKEKFIKILTKLQKDDEYVDELNTMFRKYNPDNTVVSNNNGLIILDLLARLISKEHPDWVLEWLDYFCYELDFGKEYKAGSITYDDGTEIPMSNIEELWVYLEKEYMTKEKE